MEYEIGDDPQGLPDRPEGDRDGGLHDTLFFAKRRRTPSTLAPGERGQATEQLGEPA